MSEDGEQSCAELHDEDREVREMCGTIGVDDGWVAGKFHRPRSEVRLKQANQGQPNGDSAWEKQGGSVLIPAMTALPYSNDDMGKPTTEVTLGA